MDPFFLVLAFFLLALAHDIGHQPVQTLYVASQSSGILQLAFDPSQPVNNSLRIVNQIHAGEKPNWLTVHKDKLYSISRTSYPDITSSSGGIFEFQHSPARALSSITSVSSQGEGGVHIDVNPQGTLIAAANIDGASVSIHALNDGRIGALRHVFEYTLMQPGPGTNDSQIQSNAHQARFDPSGRYLVVPDRGADRVYVYSVAKDVHATDILLFANITLPPGTGPRHAVLRSAGASTGLLMYVVGELDNTVRAITVDEAGWRIQQTISTLGEDRGPSAPDNKDLAAEIEMTRDGRFLYVSNRNTQGMESDTIATFAVERQKLRYVGSKKTGGKIPRHFSLSRDPANRWLAVANQVTQDVQIFEREKDTGLLGERVGYLSLGEDIDLSLENGPICVVWW